ncbi:hypothetical protein MMC29_000017 [Sticta canariensis]|nr:hypothetical protein [Sticta canariensis]
MAADVAAKRYSLIKYCSCFTFGERPGSMRSTPRNRALKVTARGCLPGERAQQSHEVISCTPHGLFAISLGLCDEVCVEQTGSESCWPEFCMLPVATHGHVLANSGYLSLRLAVVFLPPLLQANRQFAGRNHRQSFYPAIANFIATGRPLDSLQGQRTRKRAFHMLLTISTLWHISSDSKSGRNHFAACRALSSTRMYSSDMLPGNWAQKS